MSSDPNELNQGENEENEAVEQPQNDVSTPDSTEETLNEENEGTPDDAPQTSAEAEITVEEAATASEAEAEPASQEAPQEEEPTASEPETAPEVVAEEEIKAEDAALADDSAAEIPADSQVETPSAVEPTSEEPTSEEAEVEEAEAETPEASNPEKSTAEEETTSEELEDDSPLTLGENFSEEAMLKQIDQILEEETNLDQLIETATPHELIFMLDHFYKADEVRPYIRRVGLIKRSFDGLRDKEELPKEVLARFSTALARFNKKRSEYQAEQDKVKESNSQKKRDLITRLKAIVDLEDANKIDEVRTIQDEWKKVGYVKREDMDELFREYRFLLDTFYKNRELHFQLRDYDRQINLQEKERLLEELQTIIPEEEERENRDIWVAKNDLLTDIQMRWRAVGHVPKEDLDRINDSYREITGQFFAIRREFFERQDEAKKENEDQKRELLEKMKAFEAYHSDKPKDWNIATDQLRELQEAWKEIGPAPKEVNSDLWKEYRNVGNTFFGKKADFFRHLDEKRNENLEKKRELCEKAEAMKG